MPSKPPMPDMLKTRSHAWREVGLARQLNTEFVRRARRELVGIVIAFGVVIAVYNERANLFGRQFDTPARIVTALALIILGWGFARDAGRALGPQLFRRLDPATAGIVGFVIRLAAIGIAVIIALNVAGLDPATLLAGGAFTAVILGLAAQQTLGNLIAGTVLISARPFRVGDRVRFEAGAIGGKQEGVVSSLGLLYTTLAAGDNLVLVPNSQVLNAVVIPLREPDAVELLARVRVDVGPSDLQALLDEKVTVATRKAPHIAVEEIDADEVVLRIQATPESRADGSQLADQILEAIATVTSEEAAATRGQASGRRQDTGTREGQDGEGPVSPDAPTRTPPRNRESL